MAKKNKEARVQVILECTEHKDSGMPGTSRYYCPVRLIEKYWARLWENDDEN